MSVSSSNKIISVLAVSALAWSAYAQDDASVEEQSSPCEQACIREEEACYERCPSDEEDSSCSDACYSTADACLNLCTE